MFLMLHSVNWLPILLKTLGNICITIVCWPGCDIIKFEVNLIILIKPFWYMTEKSRQKLKYLENKTSFSVKISIFSSFVKKFQLPKTVSDSVFYLFYKVFNQYIQIIFNFWSISNFFSSFMRWNLWFENICHFRTCQLFQAIFLTVFHHVS